MGGFRNRWPTVLEIFQLGNVRELEDVGIAQEKDWEDIRINGV